MAKPSKPPPSSTMASDPIGWAHWMLATVADLEEQYKEEFNPVYVWEAIDRIHVASRMLERPMVLPDWILGYLTKAALVIVGGALGLPDGNRHTPMPSTENSDGTRTHYSDHFRGLTPSQRRDVLLEALGFKSTKGKNPFMSARRTKADAARVQEVEKLEGQGLSKKAAAYSAGDPRLRMSADPDRKVRRDRKKLRGEK